MSFLVRQFKVEPPIARRSRSVTIGEGRVRLLALGRLSEVGPRRDVALSSDREHVVAIVGKRGSGKTHTLGVLVEELAGASPPSDEGSGVDRAVLIFDTLNLFQWVNIPLFEAKGPAAEQQQRLLRMWKLAPLELAAKFWHPVGCRPAVEGSAEFTIRPADMEAQDWSRLLGVDLVSEPMGQLVGEVHDKVTRSGWASDVGAQGPFSDYSVEDLLSCLREDAVLNHDFAPETVRAVRQRLQAYDRSGLFSKQGPTWKQFLAPGRVSVLLLARASEDVRSVVAFLVIRRLLEERAQASEATKAAVISGHGNVPQVEVPPTWVVIDEAQNVMPAKGATAANEILTRYVREGRNFGLSLAVSSQQPSALDPRVMAQVDVLIAHTLTARQDVNYVLGNLKSAEPKSILHAAKRTSLADALRMLEAGQCMVSATDGERALFLEVRPRRTVHGGFEA